MAGYDFHIHSLFSDGELIPAEIAQRYSELGYEAIAITDHADDSNLDFILSNLVRGCKELNKNIALKVLPGIELTHIPPKMLAKLVKRARSRGAKVVIVHGETLMEPVAKGTNAASVKIKEVDILAHPGLITREEALLAAKNDIYLELSARRGHCLTNGHVARTAQEVGAKLLVNTDAHSPSDIVAPDRMQKIAMGAGLDYKHSKIITSVNPGLLLGGL